MGAYFPVRESPRISPSWRDGRSREIRLFYEPPGGVSSDEVSSDDMDTKIPLYKKDCRRIIVRKGNDFVLIRIEDIAYFFLDNKISLLVERTTGVKYMVCKPLRDLQSSLSVQDFFRANKKYLISINAIERFRPVGKGKIEILLNPAPKEKILISQLKATCFRKWVATGDRMGAYDPAYQAVEN
jgi:DNA-binding LytR/AlgR family response regulator